MRPTEARLVLLRLMTLDRKVKAARSELQGTQYFKPMSEIYHKLEDLIREFKDENGDGRKRK